MKFTHYLFAVVIFFGGFSLAEAATIQTGPTCSLANAILSAEMNASYGACAAGTASDVIRVNQNELVQNIPAGTYPDGNNAFKATTSNITIIGNGHTVTFQNNSGTPGRLFNVVGGNLQINSLNFEILPGNTPLVGDGGFMFANGSTVGLTMVNINGFGANNSGGAIFSQNANLNIIKSTLEHNTSFGNAYTTGGGGVYLSGGSLNVIDSTFDNNHAVYQGGAIFTSGDFNTLSVDRSKFVFNTSDYGSAINAGLGSNNKVMTLKNTEFHMNYANIGGAFSWRGSAGKVVVNNTTFLDNKGFSDGAAIQNSDGTAKFTIINSTFSKNESFGIGSAILNSGEEAEFKVAYNTFATNNSNGNGGVFTSVSPMAWVDSVLENNIFSQNIGGDCNLASTVNFTMTNNLSNDGTCGNIIATGVDTLAINNGGSTKTHKLLSGSNAIDAAVTNPLLVKIPCPSADQRAVARPFDGNNDGIAKCDIGAYEYNKRASVQATTATVKSAFEEPTKKSDVK